ncbi:unnamed protein product [Ambrosiozyma monospora]|uniref:Unnamed protein product n=1 Tax=Ambrosiozyma monospora TaxID=43982 RepID=A0ACB5U969_AMBMO|nr:unnamed protein product [Ambrosiozyma monospora]
MCLRYKDGKDCIYNDNIDKRKKKYDSARIDYLELKSDILEQYAINLIQTVPELKGVNINSILPPPLKLTSNNDTSQLKQVKGLRADPTAIEDMVSTAWKVRSDGNKTVFYGPLSGRQGVHEEEETNDEDNLIVLLGNMDFNYRDATFKNHLFDLFNDNFAQYFAYSHSKLGQIRTWQFPNPDPSKHLLLCVIFAYSCAYDNRYAKAAKLLLNEADAMLMATYRNNMNEHVLHALLILSCYEVGRGHDSNSWIYNAMVCSQAQYLGLHLREGTRQGDVSSSTSTTTSTPNVLVNTSPSNIALFWAILFQDRSITTVLGRSCQIQYFRMTVPFHTSRLNLRLCGNDQNLIEVTDQDYIFVAF